MGSQGRQKQVCQKCNRVFHTECTVQELTRRKKEHAIESQRERKGAGENHTMKPYMDEVNELTEKGDKLYTTSGVEICMKCADAGNQACAMCGGGFDE